MSLVLYSEPIVPVERVSHGGHPVKGIFADAYFEHDGSLREEVILGMPHIPQLLMLKRVMHNEELAETVDHIIAQIEKHGAVRLFTDE